MTKTLAELLCENRDPIQAHLSLGSVHWRDLVCRVRGSSAARDEQLWTFLAACGYAIAGADGVRRLTGILAGQRSGSVQLENMAGSNADVPQKEGRKHPLARYCCASPQTPSASSNVRFE